MPYMQKVRVVYFSVVVDQDEDEDEVIERCYHDLKHGACGLRYSHTNDEEVEEMTQEEVDRMFNEN
jgi:hypothetical protein